MSGIGGNPFGGQVGIPKLDAEFTDENRCITQPWYRLIIQLWKNSGGSKPAATVLYLILNPITGAFDVYQSSTGQKIGSVPNALQKGNIVDVLPTGANPLVFATTAPGAIVVDGAQVELSRDAGVHWYTASLVGGSFGLRNGDSARVSWKQGTPNVSWWGDGYA